MELSFTNQLKTPKSISSESKTNIFSSVKKLAVNIYQKKKNNQYNKYQIVKRCLNSLDIFNNIMDQNPQQIQKIIKDVRNIIEIKIYQEDQIIYSINQQPQYFYLILKGQVSAFMPKQIQNQQGQKTVQWKQIDRFSSEQAFGNAQFIAGKTRDFTAFAKQPQTVLGLLNHQLFTQIIQKYKMRVYFKKRSYFLLCPLFQILQQNYLEMIVGHSKPKQFRIGQVIFKQDFSAKNFYYILSGQIQLYQTKKKSQFKNHDEISELKMYTPKKLLPLKYRIDNNCALKKVTLSTLSQGSFIGDTQIILNKKYQYSAKCITQKVKVYYVNKNIIENILTKKDIDQLTLFYQNKNNYYSKRLDNQLNLSQSINSKLKKYFANQPPTCLTERQIQNKRLILKRYVEAVPTSIGLMGPKQIQKYVQRKEKLFQKRQKREFLPKIKKINSEKSHAFKFKKSGKTIDLIKKRVLTENVTDNSYSFFNNNEQQERSISALGMLRPTLVPNVKLKKNYEKSLKQRIKTEPETQRSINIQQSQNKIKELIKAQWQRFGSHQLLVLK